MNDSIYYISLDIHDVGTQIRLNAKHADTKRKIIARLTDGGLPYTISADCTAFFTAKKPDGNVIYNACTITDGCIVYTITAQTTAAAGRVDCEFKLYGSDSALITSPRFALLVDPAVYDANDELESATEATGLTALVAEVQELKDDYQELIDAGGTGGSGSSGGITEETDPTVPEWAKADTKPTYTAQEVGALPDTTTIPDVPFWALEATKPAYTASEVGALPDTTTIPTELKNPKALTLTGAVTATYDGSEAVTVNIPSGGSGSGTAGADGATFTPSVSADGDLSWSNDKGLTNPTTVNIKGATGAAGADGADGEDGATFTPNVAANGDLSWTNDKGLDNPATVNIKGATGAAGADGTNGTNGSDGATFTPSVSAAGELSWTNDKGLTNPTTVNIKGAKGDTGEQGAQGAQGATGAQGAVGAGIATGGTTGQMLVKASGTDYDTEWDDVPTVSSLGAEAALPIVTSEAGTYMLALTDSGVWQLSTLTALTLSGAAPADGIARVYEIFFTSGTTATTLSVPATWVFSGDDCDEDVFTPVASTDYEIVGTWYGSIVRWAVKAW